MAGFCPASGRTPAHPQHTCYTTLWHTTHSPCPPDIMASSPGVLYNPQYNETVRALGSTERHKTGARTAIAPHIHGIWYIPPPGKSSRTCQQHADTAETENCRPMKSGPAKKCEHTSPAAWHRMPAPRRAHQPAQPSLSTATTEQHTPPAQDPGTMGQLRHSVPRPDEHGPAHAPPVTCINAAVGPGASSGT